MSSRYNDRDLVYVTPFAGSTIRYGFQTGIDQQYRTILGQTNVGQTLPQGFVVGADSPKPARARRTLAAGGTVSSFISAEAIGQARAQGWSIGKARRKTGAQGTRTSIAYVTFNGIDYAWRLPNSTRDRIGGDLAGLGIRLATGQENNLVFGANSPKPPTVEKVVGDDKISTFCDPSVTVPEGWVKTEEFDPSLG